MLLIDEGGVGWAGLSETVILMSGYFTQYREIHSACWSLHLNLNLVEECFALCASYSVPHHSKSFQSETVQSIQVNSTGKLNSMAIPNRE